MSLLCCFKCFSWCGCREKILEMYAFFPPNPSGYSFYQDPTEESEKKKLKINFLEDNGQIKNLPPISGLEYFPHSYERNDGKTCSAIEFNYTKIRSEYIIIFSHGNSTDIGRMVEAYLDLTYNLKINLFAYEYTGYGLLKGTKPSDHQLILDIQAAYKYVNEELRYPWHKIILYGQSIGSGPSTFLASSSLTPVAALILHSPIASGYRILDLELRISEKNDFFPNFELIEYVNCPVFLMHGLEDFEVPIDHSYLLFKRCKNVYEGWWVEKAGHNNIDLKQRKTYFSKLFEFLAWLREKQVGVDEKQLLKRNKAGKWQKEFKHFYRKFLEEGGGEEGGRENEEGGEEEGVEGKRKRKERRREGEREEEGEKEEEEEKTGSYKGSKKGSSSNSSMQKSSKLSIEMPQSFSTGGKEELVKRTMAKEEK